MHESDRQKLQRKNVRINFLLMNIFDVLCKHPIVTIKDLQKLAEIDSYVAASRGVQVFKELGILKEMNENKRNKKYVFEDYLNILRRDTLSSMD